MENKKKSLSSSRRKFLKTAWTAAGGLALTRCSEKTPTPLPTRMPSLFTPSASPAVPIYPDPSRPLAERAHDLVDRITVS